VCDANVTISMCRLSRHSGKLVLLEPSGTVQTYTGIAINIAILNCYSFVSNNVDGAAIEFVYQITRFHIT